MVRRVSAFQAVPEEAILACIFRQANKLIAPSRVD